MYIFEGCEKTLAIFDDSSSRQILFVGVVLLEYFGQSFRHILHYQV